MENQQLLATSMDPSISSQQRLTANQALQNQMLKTVMAITPLPPEATTASETGYVYHATNLENAHDILSSGHLEAHEPSFGTDQDAWPDGGTEKRSYWSKNAGAVHSFAPAEGRSVILRAPQKAAKFMRESTGDMFTRQRVPAQHLEILTKDGWRPISELSKP
jgi:hypothetical protein